MELKLNSIKFSRNNKRIDFEYSTTKDIKKYFSDESFFIEFEEDISSVPFEILIIPFLANVMPIAWFAGFNVNVESVDSIFLESLTQLKKEFSKYYSIDLPESNNLKYTQSLRSDLKFTNKAMLFSGGVDAYTTYLRHVDEDLHLITIKGADIKLNDSAQWEDLTNYLETTDLINKNIKHYISSNIRDFITFEVDKLLPNLGWWGKIQHGLSLTCLSAPICYIHQIDILYIASTRSIKMKFSPWGSMPETDNLIKWSNSTIFHDGYELSRFDKVTTILNSSDNYTIKPPLRVCYNEFKSSLNCNECEKCLRTMFSIMVQGKDPNKYGFEIDNTVYERIFNKLQNGFSTEGTKMYWMEMIENINLSNLFIFSDRESEINNLTKIKELVNNISDKEIGVVSDFNKFKYSIIKKFPKTFTIYLNFRRKFL
ncbi:hypothetical protein [Faecalibacter rhinopitheci]|uniref:Uncharacterized protein n=1 Tax=Faecalibacter rhinopitheci TaxID=2779678 RepID=A0A8J7FSY6_9FLAO|nr:hypothetical protein [Faecalibacter rhinopitheci]MBF0598348.1 hypothetical protein [Faecalibacter rhinopitheci]